MAYDPFYSTPIDFLIHEWLPAVNLAIEPLRERKLIGKNRDVRLVLRAHSKGDGHVNYDFFRLWSIRHWGGTREIAKVCEIEVQTDESLTSPWFAIDAYSVVEDPAFGQCPRCQDYHRKKIGWHQAGKFMCVKCERALGAEWFAAHAAEYALELAETS